MLYCVEGDAVTPEVRLPLLKPEQLDVLPFSTVGGGDAGSEIAAVVLVEKTGGFCCKWLSSASSCLFSRVRRWIALPSRSESLASVVTMNGVLTPV